MNIPPVFQPFIAATKTAIAYLQSDYGYRLTVQQAIGSEAWVIYESATTRITVHYELGTVPWVEIGRLELRDGEITQPASIDLERILRARGNALDHELRVPRDFGESEIGWMVSIRADRLRATADDVLRGDFRAFPKLQAKS